MKLKLKKKVRNTIIIIPIALIALLGILFLVYQYQLSPISKNDDAVIVEIPAGTNTEEIGTILSKNHLIRSKNFFVLYLKLNKINTIKASTYELNENMSLPEIVKIISKGNSYNPDAITITFKEGLNVRQIAQLIADTTNHSYEEVMTVMQDGDFIDRMIDEYWFLTDEIKNSDIYYPLEGYLFPNTYQFMNKEVSIEEIITTMLDEMDQVLTEDQKEISKSNLSIHELLTLASIVELEGVGDTDRDMIAGVFYNRLAAGWSLGSDVTACYAFQVNIDECNDDVDYTKYNPYNTRSSAMAGKLPVGPICNPSKNSILGSISPKEHDYYYFVADKYKKVYFTKTEQEHQQKIAEIKKRGDWPW